MVVVEVDDAGASVGFSLGVGTGLGISSLGTEPLFSAIAFFFVEPTSSRFHFQSGGTAEFSVFGVGLFEEIMASGVEGDVCLSALLGDVSIDEPCVEGGVGQEGGGFEAV